MTKLTMTVEQAAHLLIEVAREGGIEQFAETAREVLQGTPHDEIALIGQCLPPTLRDLLPRPLLH